MVLSSNSRKIEAASESFGAMEYVLIEEAFGGRGLHESGICIDGRVSWEVDSCVGGQIPTGPLLGVGLGVTDIIGNEQLGTRYREHGTSSEIRN